MAKKQSKPQPIKEVRIGSIKAAIWRNDGDSGPRFNVTFQRLYRSEAGKWQSTNSFSRDDLLGADEGRGRNAHPRDATAGVNNASSDWRSLPTDRLQQLHRGRPGTFPGQPVTLDGTGWKSAVPQDDPVCLSAERLALLPGVPACRLDPAAVVSALRPLLGWSFHPLLKVFDATAPQRCIPRRRGA